MDTTIHDITKITLNPIETNRLENTEKDFFTRKILFKTSEGEVLEINCFSDDKESLKIETEEIVKI